MTTALFYLHLHALERLTFYTHYLDLTKLLGHLMAHYGAAYQSAAPDDANRFQLTAGPVEAPVLRLTGRHRLQPSYFIDAVTDGLTQNLAGMHGFVATLPMADEALKNKLLTKITTINTEVTVAAEPAFPAGFADFLGLVLADYEAFVFSEPNSQYPLAAGQGFYDQDGHLLTDMAGHGDAAASVQVTIERKYYDSPTATPDQLTRKARSEARLQAEEILFSTTLPPIVSEEAARLRSLDEMVDRALALCYLGLKSEGLEPEHLADFAQRYTVLGKLSPNEMAYVHAPEPTEQQTIDANWRYEGLHVLLWALGFLPELSFPGETCDVAEEVGLVWARDEAEFRAEARLRPLADILDAADLVYRYAWACVEARLHQRPAPGGLNKGVVHEWHYTLNWLIGHQDKAWDDISTDT